MSESYGSPDQQPGTVDRALLPVTEALISPSDALPEVALQEQLEAPLPRHLTAEQRLGRAGGVSIFQDQTEAQAYLNLVRRMYREGQSSFKGRENDEQLVVAAELGDKANQLIEAASSLAGGSPDAKIGDVHFQDFQQAFSRAFLSLGIITNRLVKKDLVPDPNNPTELTPANDYQAFAYPELAEMTTKDIEMVASQLFADFQDQNALRFGVEGAGVTGQIRTGYTDYDFEPIYKQVDLDVERGERALTQRTNAVRYVQPIDAPSTASSKIYPTRFTVHTASKWATSQIKALRKDFPQVPVESFYKAIDQNRDARTALTKYMVRD